MGGNLLNSAIETLLYYYIILYYVKENTRIPGKDEPCIFDLVFTRLQKEINKSRIITSICRHYHVVLDCKFMVTSDVSDNIENCRDNLNFRK